MEITRAPLRVSFAGGGTDIEPYCSEYGGAVLAGAIQIYAQAFYPSQNVIPSEMEREINDCFGLGQVKITNGAPQMSGLGGSASCFVAGIKAVRPDLGKEAIAKLAIHLERRGLGIPGGKQDQYMAAFGGLNYMTFTKDKVDIESLKIPDGLESLLLLVYMGKRSNEGQYIIKDQMERFKARSNIQAFDVLKSLAGKMRQFILDEDLELFGKHLGYAWNTKKFYSPLITTPKIDAFYDDCQRNGAIGGKLTGAGGGGFMLLMEHPSKQGELRTYLREKNIDYHNIKFDTEGVCVKNP